MEGLGIKGAIVTPSSPDYEQAIARASAVSVLKAAYVVYPDTPSDISTILNFARSQNPPLEVAVKCGGCLSTTASSSQGGIVIDLSHLKAVKVAEDKKSVSIGGGSLWGDVYSELEKHEIVVIGGNVWSVGVGGYLTGGGYSYLSGNYGLAIDNFLAATVVLADGRIVQCSLKQEPDLFWAIRGGGNQFGVVTEFVVKAYPARGPALVGALGYPGTELSGVLKAVHTFLSTQPSSAKIIIAFARAPPHFYPSVLILPYVEGQTEQSDQILAPFRSPLKPVFEQTAIVPNFNAVSHAADAFMSNVPPRYISAGALFGDLWDDVVGKVFGDWVAFTEQDEFKGSSVMWEFDYGDKIAAVSREETAFPVRKPHYYVVATARHTSPDSDAVAREWVAKTTAYIKKANTDKTGNSLPTPANFALGNETTEEVYGENLNRLKKLKAKYDPKKVWSKGWLLEPNFD